MLNNSLISGVFITFGLSGIAPATHFGYVNGWQKSIDEAAIPWLILMGILYITGALLYAMRIPERFFPGKVDIWVSTIYRMSNRRSPVWLKHFFFQMMFTFIRGYHQIGLNLIGEVKNTEFD